MMRHPFAFLLCGLIPFGTALGQQVGASEGTDGIVWTPLGKIVDIRVPYPLGFFTKLVDGRIDDPNAGWKGKGLWTMSGTRTVFHNEGGTSNYPKVYKLQLRPDPLAKR